MQSETSLSKLPAEKSRELHNCAFVNGTHAMNTTEKLTTLWKKQDQPLAYSQGKSLAQPILSPEINITFDL